MKFREVLILLIALELFASARILANPQVKTLYGGTLVIGHNNSPTIINPVLTDSTVSMSIMALIFNRLVKREGNGEIGPDLAESWEVSSDGLVYTFYLRHGVKFHDGAELTAEDVLYTYEQIIAPENHSPFAGNLYLVKRFEMLNRYVFQVVLKTPCVSFIDAMIREVAPKHLNRYPIGTGPFRFKQWSPDNQITLEANPDYFGGRPYLDRIVYKTYPTDADVWSALMRGEVDLVEFLSVENYELTKKDPSFKTYANLTADCYLISYNLDDPTISDRKVRLAIAHAVDRKGLVRIVEKGYGVEATGPFSSESWAYDPEVHPFLYDPSAALKLLKEAGWKDADGDGIMDKNGSKLVIRMLVDSKDEKLKRMGMFIRQNLQEVNIELKIQLYDNAKEIEQLTSSGRYQAILTSFLGTTVDPNETIKLWYSLDQRAGKIWPHKVSNPDLDRLIHLGVVTRDKKNRQKIYQQIHRTIYQEQPACFLYFPFDFHAVSKKFNGTEAFLGSLHMPDDLIREFYMRRFDSKKEGGDT